jgi:hypothetical protein
VDYYKAFICCYFNQEDCDCIGVHIVFTLFCSDECLWRIFEKFLVISWINRAGKVVVKI